MHPALSVLFFTTLSGAGYGLLFLLGTGVALGIWPHLPLEIAMPLAIGLGLVALGLASSMAHLGQPARAWRAFTQWRTSWLSREGVLAVLGFAPALALGFLYFTPVEGGMNPPLQRACGATMALLAVATVYCTAQIYASLKTVPAWHNPYVTPGYFLFALYSAGLWLWALGAWYRRGDPQFWPQLGLPPGVLFMVVVVAMLACVQKLLYWRHIDNPPVTATVESATGLNDVGAVSAFERPHTEENYITREMVFVLARKHSTKLRAIALLFAFALPLAALVFAMLWVPTSFVLATVALVSASVGIFVERWLFFAEARHVVSLYYGEQKA
ncbi:dimethyl sulfoxide reductase anchor subunit family protein [Tahibacter amnicola]|uniref:Dimethyl sulfoxide reductase anchor subunit n=1 Tax=Tahibacter amnicola TaxID=2976241 RepID=A0ABY6BDA8_9GAMM|nr:DmsC/YnfH family molybdoenzyme membrane anchor subunit [Tahibacter amnicola]UXI67844.1 dimethyl sulfoxide reductase anchor subunit [Tahibacter amnicola]